MTDYDATDIPTGYDRARDHGPEVLDLWMRTIRSRLEDLAVERILELGCGTGRFTPALAAHFDARVVGLDPSARMLQQAEAKSHDARVAYCRARAEAVPVANNSVDLVFMSMSFHHFTEPHAAVSECKRVLRSRGRVVLRGGVRDQAAGYPYTPFFPSLATILERMLPSRRELRELFARGGLQLISWEVVEQTIARNWLDYADKLAAGGDSALARLDRDEFEKGVAAVRHFGAGHGGSVIEPIDLFVFGPSTAARS